MCGIVGWLGKTEFHQQWKHKSHAFLDGQQHRGPDSRGQYIDDKNGLFIGHNRLSIIDLTELGNQPMKCDRGNVLAFNGEIYNHIELRGELTELGYTFKSKSDTEVLLIALQNWGIECLPRLNGMFAFAYWQQVSQTLHLVRDPMGIKPLYYSTSFSESTVVFSSELNNLRSNTDKQSKIDSRTLKQVLEFGHSIDEHATIFEDMLKVAPGQRLEFRRGTAIKRRTYYQPNNCLISCDNKVEHERLLFKNLETVVRQHFVADVPVGLLLSGGLDSSLIAALASKHRQIHTISMGFSDSSVDEREYAREVASLIGSQHTEVLITPQDILESVEHVASHFDDVFVDWGLISTRLLYEKCSQNGIKVVLVGEGSDELFGGYPTYRFAQKSKPNEWSVFKLYRMYAGRRYGSQYFAFRKLIKSYLRRCNNDLFSALRMFETRNRLPNNYIQKVDKASMSVSVEARTPFLDVRIADIAYATPSELLLNAQDEKLILKRIARKHSLLPESILQRQKFGAGIASDWLTSSKIMREYARDVILDTDGLSHQLGYSRAMKRFFDDGKIGYRAPHPISLFSNLAWRLLILNLWARSLDQTKRSD